MAEKFFVEIQRTLIVNCAEIVSMGQHDYPPNAFTLVIQFRGGAVPFPFNTKAERDDAYNIIAAKLGVIT